MALEPDDCALFDMLREEAVPPPLATAIVLKLLGHPDAAPALAITPIEAKWHGVAAPARPSDPQHRPHRPSQPDMGDHGADPQPDRACPPSVQGRGPAPDRRPGPRRHHAVRPEIGRAHVWTPVT